jgi:hypothetical protein
MTKPLEAHNGEASFSIKGGNHLGGGVLGTWRREIVPWILRTCDICLGG